MSSNTSPHFFFNGFNVGDIFHWKVRKLEIELNLLSNFLSTCFFCFYFARRLKQKNRKQVWLRVDEVSRFSSCLLLYPFLPFWFFIHFGGNDNELVDLFFATIPAWSKNLPWAELRVYWADNVFLVLLWLVVGNHSLNWWQRKTCMHEHIFGRWCHVFFENDVHPCLGKLSNLTGIFQTKWFETTKELYACCTLIHSLTYVQFL